MFPHFGHLNQQDMNRPQLFQRQNPENSTFLAMEGNRLLDDHYYRQQYHHPMGIPLQLPNPDPISFQPNIGQHLNQIVGNLLPSVQPRFDFLGNTLPIGIQHPRYNQPIAHHQPNFVTQPQMNIQHPAGNTVYGHHANQILMDRDNSQRMFYTSGDHVLINPTPQSFFGHSGNQQQQIISQPNAGIRQPFRPQGLGDRILEANSEQVQVNSASIRFEFNTTVNNPSHAPLPITRDNLQHRPSPPRFLEERGELVQKQSSSEEVVYLASKSGDIYDDSRRGKELRRDSKSFNQASSSTKRKSIDVDYPNKRTSNAKSREEPKEKPLTDEEYKLDLDRINGLIRTFRRVVKDVYGFEGSVKNAFLLIPLMKDPASSFAKLIRTLLMPLPVSSRKRNILIKSMSAVIGPVGAEEILQETLGYLRKNNREEEAKSIPVVCSNANSRDENPETTPSTSQERPQRASRNDDYQQQTTKYECFVCKLVTRNIEEYVAHMASREHSDLISKLAANSSSSTTNAENRELERRREVLRTREVDSSKGMVRLGGVQPNRTTPAINPNSHFCPTCGLTYVGLIEVHRVSSGHRELMSDSMCMKCKFCDLIDFRTEAEYSDHCSTDEHLQAIGENYQMSCIIDDDDYLLPEKEPRAREPFTQPIWGSAQPINPSFSNNRPINPNPVVYPPAPIPVLSNNTVRNPNPVVRQQPRPQSLFSNNMLSNPNPVVHLIRPPAFSELPFTVNVRPDSLRQPLIQPNPNDLILQLNEQIGVDLKRPPFQLVPAYKTAVDKMVGPFLGDYLVIGDTNMTNLCITQGAPSNPNKAGTPRVGFCERGQTFYSAVGKLQLLSEEGFRSLLFNSQSESILLPSFKCVLVALGLSDLIDDNVSLPHFKRHVEKLKFLLTYAFKCKKLTFLLPTVYTLWGAGDLKKAEKLNFVMRTIEDLKSNKHKGFTISIVYANKLFYNPEKYKGVINMKFAVIEKAKGKENKVGGVVENERVVVKTEGENVEQRVGEAMADLVKSVESLLKGVKNEEPGTVVKEDKGGKDLVAKVGTVKAATLTVKSEYHDYRYRVPMRFYYAKRHTEVGQDSRARTGGWLYYNKRGQKRLLRFLCQKLEVPVPKKFFSRHRLTLGSDEDDEKVLKTLLNSTQKEQQK